MTYFGGNEAAGLKPDDECKQIWLNLGYVCVFPLLLLSSFDSVSLVSLKKEFYLDP